jgi:Rhs element Vgr protein
MPALLADTNTDVTNYEIVLGGETISPASGVLSVVIHRGLNRIASAEIVFTDANHEEEEFPWSNKDFTKPGTEVEIKAGYHDEMGSVFKGIVVRQHLRINKKSTLLVVECKDKAVKMSTIRRSAYFADVKDSDVWSQLIGDAGLTADISSTTIQHKELVQYSCSDWDFIVARAELNGMVVANNDASVKVMKPASAGMPVVTANYPSNIFEFDADMDARTQHKQVKAKTWNAADQEIIEETSAEPSLLLNGDISGSDLADAVAGNDYEVFHSGKIMQDELKAWADAKLIKSRLSKIRGRVKIQGNGKVNPGDVVALEGVGARFSGNVMAVAVRHELAKGNWYTDIQFGQQAEWYANEMEINERPASSMIPAIHGLQIGIVTALENDPENEFRIKVKVPVINKDDEGVWSRLATPDAGNKRGIVIRPEVGDEVIVGFINDDPRDCIVLGCLHSSKNAAPIEAKDDNHEKGWTTRSEMKLLFNDDKKTILISTPADNKIQLSEDEKSILIQDQNGNKIEMNSDGITMESCKDVKIKATGDIKMEGINIESKASAGYKAQGSASAEVSSSATTTVKGSMVMIN